MRTRLKIGLKTMSVNENCPTLVFSQQKKIQKQHKKKGLGIKPNLQKN